MTAYYPPIKNGVNGYVFATELTPSTPTGSYLTSPTLATGDVMVSLDGGAFANLATLPVVTPSASGQVLVTLSQAETNADNICVRFKDVAGAEWLESRINIQTIASSSSLAGVTGTDVSICNMALDLLVEAPITAFDDDTPEADWFARNFAVMRDAELEENAWKFALKRATVTVDVTAPDFEDWSYRYAIPADCLRVLPLRYDGSWQGKRIPFEVEGGYILTDQSTSLKLLYIYRNTDVSTYPALFKQALAAKLAVALAHWLTGKIAMVQVVTAAYNIALDKAKVANALIGTQEKPDDDDVIDQRYDAEGIR